MISRFSISNFRCFESLELTDLAQINLFVGRNGAGKSALLEGIWAGRQSFKPEALLDLLRLRGELPEKDDTSSQLYRSLRSLYQSPAESLRFDHTSNIGKNTKESFAALNIVKRAKLLDRVVDGILSSVDLSEYCSDEYLGERKFIGFEYYNDFFLSTYGLDHDSLGVLWDRITLTDVEDHVDAAIRLLRPDAQRIAFIGDPGRGRMPVVKLAGKDAVPMARLGDGIQRIFGIALSLAFLSKNAFQEWDSVLLIDEIETGLHYSAMPDLWRLVFSLSQTLKVQVFATTHSWDCIRGFAKASQDNPDISARLTRLEQHDTLIRTVHYDRETLAAATENGIEVR